MARSHVRWQFGVWRRPGHADTSKDARNLFVNGILSDELLNQAGVVRVALDMWAEDAGMTLDDAQVALAELHKREFVVHDGHELLVRTFIRNDGVADQPNVLRAALRAAHHIRSPMLRRALARELRKLPPALPSTQLKNGRTFVYPDPHECADDIDPDGPDTGASEPVDNPDQNPSRNPSDNPSPGTLPRTLGGGGGGGGTSFSPVGGSVGGSRAHAREAPGPPSTPDAPPPPLPGLIVGLPAGIPDEPPRCRRCARLPPDVDQPCRTCRRLRESWEADVASRDQAAAQHRNALAAQTAAAAAACTRCDHGWLLAPDGTPAVPARRCHHQQEARHA